MNKFTLLLMLFFTVFAYGKNAEIAIDQQPPPMLILNYNGALSRDQKWAIEKIQNNIARGWVLVEDQVIRLNAQALKHEKIHYMDMNFLDKTETLKDLPIRKFPTLFGLPRCIQSILETKHYLISMIYQDDNFIEGRIYTLNRKPNNVSYRCQPIDNNLIYVYRVD